jgi:tripartite-type tricarboxylate transporter receptor subunit TctC
MTGVDMVHIPYKGAAPALAGLMAGEVQIMFDGLGSSNQFIRSGKVKLLGTGGLKRSPSAPEAATLNESGVAGFEAGSFFGLFAPAGTPAATIGTLNTAMQKALASPQLRSRFASFDYEVAGGSPEDLGKLVVAEVSKWRKLIEDRGLKFD